MEVRLPLQPSLGRSFEPSGWFLMFSDGSRQRQERANEFRSPIWELSVLQRHSVPNDISVFINVELNDMIGTEQPSESL